MTVLEANYCGVACAFVALLCMLTSNITGVVAFGCIGFGCGLAVLMAGGDCE